MESAARSTNTRLLDLIFNKYNLVLHLSAIKRYLLLGQGDFAQHLMDGTFEQNTNSLEKCSKMCSLYNRDCNYRHSELFFDLEFPLLM